MASSEKGRSVEQRLAFSIHNSQFTIRVAVDATNDAGDVQSAPELLDIVLGRHILDSLVTNLRDN
jgi:hypothetical protein